MQIREFATAVTQNISGLGGGPCMTKMLRMQFSVRIGSLHQSRSIKFKKSIISLCVGNNEFKHIYTCIFFQFPVSDFRSRGITSYKDSDDKNIFKSYFYRNLIGEVTELYVK